MFLSFVRQVAQLKTIIQDSNSEFAVAQQKLLYSGKVLEDGVVISTLGFKEKDFLVLMISKV